MATIPNYLNRSTMTMQMLTQMRWQVDDLQRQLGSGKRSETYAGLGIGRALDLETRTRLSRLESFETTISTVNLRVNVMNTALDRIRVVGQDVRSDVRFPIEYDLIGNGQTSAQQLATMRFDEALSLLNEKTGDRYLFSGSSTDVRPTATTSQIVNGDGAQAGLKQVTAERLLADLGADGRGRLAAPLAAGTSVILAEAGTHSFGIKLAAASTSFGAAVTPTAGPPASLQINLNGVNPPEGAQVQVRFTLPDGSSLNLDLTATTQNPPPAGGFLIGANEAATALNLAGKIDSEIQRIGRTDLAAASAIQAGEDFFNIDAGNPPQRVNGPPFETAVAMRDGTTADTVFWYKGDGAAGDPRQTTVARIDETITVAYGVRANEDGLRQVVQNAAVFSSMSFSDADPDGRDRYFALAQRVGESLDQQNGVKHIEAIQTDIAGAQLSANSAKERLADKKPMLQGILDEIENITPEEVGVQLLAMSTRLQATLQTTAMLSNLSLLNYI
jgi:flagellin-like hook-associated protein FlgL